MPPKDRSTPLYSGPIRPNHLDALVFWEQGQKLLDESRQYRDNDEDKHWHMLKKAIRLQRLASELGEALEMPE